MFTIDFQKPFLYKDVVYFNQGNLSANNILRCKVVIGGDSSLEGYVGSTTFKTKSSVEINGICDIVDSVNCVIDIKFPSNALEVGINSLEIILTKGISNNKIVAQSPVIKYEVWQGLTTGNGIASDNNYPILVDLIADVNNAVRIANNANNTASVAITQTGKLIEETQNIIAEANSTIDTTNNAKEDTIKVTNQAEDKILDIENRFNRMSSEKQQDSEVIDARDGEVNLKARLDRDLHINGKSLKQEIIDLNGLKETQDMAYSTDKGYLVCKNTKNGSVKDIVIKGRTLVNLANKDRATSARENDLVTLNLTTKKLSSGTYYVYNIDMLSNKRWVSIGIYNKITDNYVRGYTLKSIITPITLNEDEYVYTSSCLYTHGWKNTDVGLFKNTVLIMQHEYEHINSYFEGLKSVGEDVDKIEVLINNSNLTYGNLVPRETINQFDITLDMPKIDPQYGINNSNNEVIFSVYNKSSDLWTRSITVHGHSKQKLNLNNEFVKYIVWFKNVGWTRELVDKSLDKVGVSTREYLPNKKSDKNPILFKDTDGIWKPIPQLTEFDVVDTVKGKWYKMGIKKVLNGSESGRLQEWGSIEGSSVINFVCNYFDDFTSEYAKLICDKLPTRTSHDRSLAGVFISNGLNRMEIGVKKDWLTTPDVVGLKDWLSKNNLTLIIESKQEKIYDIANISLDAYEDETLFMINSGVINPKCEFKLTSSLSNFVKELEDRVNRLEEDYYKSNLANFAIGLNALNTKLIVENMMKAPK